MKHMPDEFEHPPWVAGVRAALDEQVQALDAASLSRLNQARQRALEQGLAPTQRWRWPALAFASAFGLLLALALGLRMPDPSAAMPVAAEPIADLDYEMLVAGEDLELIENLEFYAWLDQQSLDG